MIESCNLFFFSSRAVPQFYRIYKYHKIYFAPIICSCTTQILTFPYLQHMCDHPRWTRLCSVPHRLTEERNDKLRIDNTLEQKRNDYYCCFTLFPLFAICYLLAEFREPWRWNNMKEGTFFYYISFVILLILFRFIEGDSFYYYHIKFDKGKGLTKNNSLMTSLFVVLAIELFFYKYLITHC